MQHLNVKDATIQNNVDSIESCPIILKIAIFIPKHPHITAHSDSKPIKNGRYFSKTKNNLYSLKLIDFSSIISYFYWTASTQVRKPTMCSHSRSI